MDNRTTHQAIAGPSVDELFQRLPPLGSDEYLRHIQAAATSDLLPEVLARAFRQLPPESRGAQATLERLFRCVGESLEDQRWDYIGFLAAYTRRRAKGQFEGNWLDAYQDLLQDAVAEVLKLLPTERGEFAEQAWNTFCRNAFEDAWRRRFGRHGEKERRLGVRVERSPPEGEEGSNQVDYLSNEESRWRVIWDHDQAERIEAIVSSVANSIEDPFARDVARAVWGSGRRPKTSGKAGEDRDPPLTMQFPGKSRDQINRALSDVDRRLAAALLAEPALDWSDDNLAFLRQESRGKRP